MSNRKTRAAKTSQAPKLGKITPTSRQPTAAQKDAILAGADKSIPAATTTPAKKRGRPAKESPQAAPQPAPAGSNGNHPKTLAAVASTVSSLSMLIPGHYSVEVASLAEAQKQYRRLQSGSNGAMPAAAVYTNGTQTYIIRTSGDACDMQNKLVAKAPSMEESAKPPAAPAEELEPATAVTIPVKHIAAALAVAAKKDTRFYLNGVYVHVVDGALRVVATDGHRLLVISSALAKDVPWGEGGVLLPREELDRIAKYIGKAKGDEEPTAMEISFGRNHPVVKVHEANGIGEFTLKPIDGKFPDYMRIVQASGDTMSRDSSPMETAAISSAYLKSAGAIAAQLESDTVFPFIGKAKADACVFTFAGEPGALLYIMPVSEARPALPAAAVRLIGETGMSGSLAALKAHETRNRKAAKDATDSKERERLTAVADGFLKRAEEIRAILSIKLAAPTAPTAKPAEEVKPQA